MKSISDVARELAEAHRKEDPETRSVFLAEDPSQAEVRLVEVSGSVGTSGETVVLPFRFAPRPEKGIPYASVLVLLSEDEWKRVVDGELTLPEGWGTAASLKAIE